MHTAANTYNEICALWLRLAQYSRQISFTVSINRQNAGTMYVNADKENGNVAVCHHKQIAIFLWKNARLYGNI